MGDFMDGEKEVLIRCCANDVGGEEERNRYDRRVSEADGANHL